MDYIPHDDNGFFGWQKFFMQQLALIYIALGISVAAHDALVALQATFMSAWAVGSESAKRLRTSVQVEAKNDARKAYEHNEFPQPLGLRAFVKAYIINNPLATKDNLIALGVPIHKKTKTKHGVATKNTVESKNKSLGAGAMLTECKNSGMEVLNPSAKGGEKSEKKTDRPSKATGYDIQIAYMIIDRGAAIPTGPDVAGMLTVLFTKARFTRQFASADIGRNLCEFYRWYNPKHPEIAGPWSTIQVTMIS